MISTKMQRYLSTQNKHRSPHQTVTVAHAVLPAGPPVQHVPRVVCSVDGADRQLGVAGQVGRERGVTGGGYVRGALGVVQGHGKVEAVAIHARHVVQGTQAQLKTETWALLDRPQGESRAHSCRRLEVKT